jgi:hypothetical protein
MKWMRIVGVLGGSVVSIALLGGSGCSSKTNGGSGTPAGGDSGPVKTTDSGSTIHDGSVDTGSASGDTGGGDDTGSQDSGDGGGDAGTQCTAAASTSGYTPPTYVPAVAHQGVCTTAQIAAFIAACGFDNGSTTACATWAQANAGDAGNTCGLCILAPMNNGGTWLDPLLKATPFDVVPNYAGCIQLTDATHGTACGTAFNNLNGCDGVACDMACADATAADAFDNCITTVNSAGCSQYNTAQNNACATDFDDAGDPTASILACFPSVASQDQDDDFNYIVNLICGSGATDGGTPSDGGAEQ